tara:strand:- start:722 stop:937 length:216 start_codon:yes stop_codon:yes gene_type:complete
MEILNKKEYEDFTELRRKKKLDADAQQIIAYLHSKYFKHSFFKPCSCSGKTWQQWIAQLNDLYEQGYQSNS